MPKLTRTQKFAELRESLANDSESSLQTKDLSDYENRLNNITGEEPRRPEPPQEDPKYIWTAFEDIQDEVKKTEEVFSTSISDLWNSIEAPVQPETVKEEIEVQEPVKEEVPVYEEVGYEETPVEVEETVAAETPVEEAPVVEVPVEEAPAAEAPVEASSSLVNPPSGPAEEPVKEESPAEEEKNLITDYILENPFAEFDEILSEKYAREEVLKAAEEPLVETVSEPVVEEAGYEEVPVAEPEEERPEEIFPETPVEEIPAEEPIEETVTTETPVEEVPVTEVFVEEPVTEETHEEIFFEAPVEEPVSEEILTAEPETAKTEEFTEEPVSFEEKLSVEETPVYEEYPFEEEELDADAVKPQPVQEENPYMGYYRVSPEVEAAYEEAEKLAAEKAAEEASLNQTVEEVVETVAESFGNNAEEVTEQPEEVSEVSYELPADNHVPDLPEESASNLIHQTISEVDRYNEENGDLTIHTLTSNMVNEIRHGESTPVTQEAEPFEEIPVPDINENEEEFSNTVSMEISKIMSDVAEDEDVREIPVEEIVTPVAEEHPALTKALEAEPEEEVVEIRNLNELEEVPSQNTLSSTIPFVVTASDEEEVIDDSAEEDSNTILNIILIILIVILVALLGLIVFYILKTKGII